jgi:hypothetical protein
MHMSNSEHIPTSPATTPHARSPHSNTPCTTPRTNSTTHPHDLSPHGPKLPRLAPQPLLHRQAHLLPDLDLPDRHRQAGCHSPAVLEAAF